MGDAIEDRPKEGLITASFQDLPVATTFLGVDGGPLSADQFIGVVGSVGTHEDPSSSTRWPQNPSCFSITRSSVTETWQASRRPASRS